MRLNDQSLKMASKSPNGLSQCVVPTNCVLVEWEFEKIDLAFKKLVEISSSLPRTIVLSHTNDYWHGVCRSLIFRFPDDLEILKISSKKILQVKSASRVGVSDLGVNKNRLANLRKKLLLSI